MSKILDWIKKHIWQTVLIGFGLFFIPLIFVHIAYRIPAISPWFASTWNSGELITYIAGFEAFIGTVVLGAATVYLNNKANETNENMLKNEEKRDSFLRQPCLYINGWSTTEISKADIWAKNYGVHIYESFLAKIVKAPETLRLAIIKIILINGSNSFSRARTRYLKINVDSEGIEQLYYPGLPTDSSKYFVQVAPTQMESIEFLIDTYYVKTFRSHSCELSLELTNSIGEQFIETVEFRLYGSKDANPYIFIKSYDTIKK